MTQQGLAGWQFARVPYPLGLVVFLVQVGLGIILFAAFQEYVTAELGGNDAWPGYLLAAYGLSRFAGETPTGSFSDGIERKLGILIGFMAMLPAVTVMALVESRQAFLGCAVLLGLGTAFLWPAAYAISADLYPAERRGKVIGFLNVAQLAGFGLGALIGAFLVEPAPRSLFVIAFGCVTAASVAAVVGIPNYRTSRLFGRVAAGQRASLRSVMSWQVALLSGLVLASSSGIAMAIPAIRPLGEDVLGVSFARMTAALIPAVVLGALLYVPAGHMADRLGRTLPFLLGQGLLVAGLLIVGGADSMLVAAIGGAVVFAGNVFSVPAWNAAVMDLAPPSHRGALIGLSVALSGLGLAIGPVVGGAISQAYGPQAVFRWAAVLAGATGVAIWLYSRRFAHHHRELLAGTGTAPGA